MPARNRITDYIGLGVVAKTFPLEKIRAALAESVRQRDLPGHVTVYYVIALGIVHAVVEGEPPVVPPTLETFNFAFKSGRAGWGIGSTIRAANE